MSFSWLGYLIALVFAWITNPLLEFFIKSDPHNMSDAEEELAKKNKAYDILLYAVVILQYAALYEFLNSIKDTTLTWYDTAGRIRVMGLLCGTFGINVGHGLYYHNNNCNNKKCFFILLADLSRQKQNTVFQDMDDAPK